MPWSDEAAHPEAGLTIAELMIVLVLLTLVIGAVYMINDAVHTITNRTEARVIAADEIRLATDSIRKDLREGQELTEAFTGEPVGTFSIASPRECVFYADVDHDNSVEKVRYVVSGGSLYRQTASAVTTPAVSTSTWRPYSTPRSLLANLDSSWSGPVFVYKSQGTTPLVLTSADPRITVVAVELRNAVNVSGVTAKSTSKATVSVRTEIQY